MVTKWLLSTVTGMVRVSIVAASMVKEITKNGSGRLNRGSLQQDCHLLRDPVQGGPDGTPLWAWAALVPSAQPPALRVPTEHKQLCSFRSCLQNSLGPDGTRTRNLFRDREAI